jgi:hypothetical protein
MTTAGAHGAGFKEPIVFAHGASPASKYRYRNGLGMVPSAEFYVFHDDFLSFMPTTSVTNGQPANTPTGWTSAVIDTGATAVVSSATSAPAASTGVLIVDSDGAAEGVALYLPKGVQLVSGKKFFMEIRTYVENADDCDLQFGLTDLTATTNPEDLYTTTAANLITFGVLDGDATTGMLADIANGGSSVQAGDIDVSDATWHILAISYDGVNAHGWVDGQKSLTLTTAANIPLATALAPFIAFRNGSAATNEGFFDYVRFSMER